MKMLFFDLRNSEREYFEKNMPADIEIEFFEEPLNENTQLSKEQLENTDALSVFITSALKENILAKFKNLRIVTTRSTGYNHIDIQYCKSRRIAVFNVSGYGQTSVAQFTIMLMIALVRNLKPAYLDIKHNKSDYSNYEGRDMNALSLGIIGGGSIGCAVCKLANALGMTVYINSPERNSETEKLATYLQFNDLIEISDIISLHIPYKTELYHMLSKNEMSRMKDGALIINTSRGELIDSSALYEGLSSGKIRGAALDVFECEDLSVHNDNLSKKIENYDKNCIANALIAQKLMEKDNVILTPHIAYNTKESIYKILDISFNNIKDYCKGMHTNQIV